MTRVLIVPAAGAGTRLQSALPKLLVPVLGRAMIDHLLDRYRGMIDKVVVVVNPAREQEVRTHLRSGRDDVRIVTQPAPTGMLDAILIATPEIRALAPEEVWITWCDQVGILAPTVTRLARAMAGPRSAEVAFPTSMREHPYIHFERDATGRLARVLQRREGDQMPAVGEGDAGLFALSGRAYGEWLPTFARATRPERGTGERNFLPFLPWAAGRMEVCTVPLTHPGESVGVNTPAELAQLEAFLRAHG